MAYTYEEAVKEFGELGEWSKDRGKIMSWTGVRDKKGPMLFSFDDGKTIYNIFGACKNELTPEQMEIFKKENPLMADFYLDLYGE